MRHKMIPYLYTANYKTYTEGEPICMPMYYRYDCKEAYEVKNQYIFGGQLMVCPITKPMDKRLNLASVRAWLPEGRWTDIFNGRIYEGGRWINLYRDLNEIPVLAPEGAIVPMYRETRTNDLSLEQPMEIHVWHGNGRYEWYEDDGMTTAFKQGAYTVTTLEARNADGVQQFIISPGKDEAQVLPASRKIYVKFCDIESAEAYVDGNKVEYTKDGICVEVSNQQVIIELKAVRVSQNKTYAQHRISLLTRVQAKNKWKNRHFKDEKRKLPAYAQEALDEVRALTWPKDNGQRI